MATNYWICDGLLNNEWGTDANWSEGTAPANDDVVIFDSAHSVEDCTVSMSTSALGSLTFDSTYSGELTVNETINLVGSLTLSANMSLAGELGQIFFELSGNANLTMNSQTLCCDIQVNNSLFTLTLQDEFNSTGSSVSIDGPFDQNGQDIKGTQISIGSNANILLDGNLTFSSSVSIGSECDTTDLVLIVESPPLGWAYIYLFDNFSVKRLVTTNSQVLFYGTLGQLNITEYVNSPHDWGNSTWRSYSGCEQSRIAVGDIFVVEGIDVAGINNTSEGVIDATDASNTDSGRNTGWTFSGAATGGGSAQPHCFGQCN